MAHNLTKYAISRRSFACLTCLALLMTGCGSPATDPNGAEAPVIEATAALSPATPDDPEPMVATVVPESAEAAEPVQAVATATAAPMVEEPQPESDTRTEAPVATEGNAPNREEGPITFKSASLHGAMTASGEPFDKDAMSAAHKTLPFGTVVTVTNLFNGKQTTVTINDRLPPHVSAVLDLSPAAAAEIDMIDAGIVEGRIDW